MVQSSIELVLSVAQMTVEPVDETEYVGKCRSF